MAKSTKKCVVITGVSRGLGLAMAEGFIEAGHVVIGCARSAAAVKKLAARFNSPHEFEAVDVTQDAEVRSWAKRVIKKHGPPDLLINNAGLINTKAPLVDVPVKEFDNVIDVNIKGTANVIRHFAPAMIERKRGVIVNFSSGWGRSTSPEVAPYCATKWAIEGLTRSLAEELPSGMAAVPLNPGVVNTDMLKQAFDDDADQYPDPETWAKKAVPFLLALGAKDNGQPLRVPGA